MNDEIDDDEIIKNMVLLLDQINDISLSLFFK